MKILARMFAVAGVVLGGVSLTIGNPSLLPGAAALAACSVLFFLLSRTSVARGAVSLLLVACEWAGWFLGKWVEQATRFLAKNPLLTPADLSALFAAARWAPVLAGLIAAYRLSRPSSSGVLSPVRKEPGDVVVGIGPRGPVVLKENDRYLHTLITGTTGTGKTSRVLKPMIWQDLLGMKAGHRMGITVIEPKGDLAQDVYEMARSLDLPCTFINPEWAGTARFNPLDGDPETAAEILRTVLVYLFGKQEAFFRMNQELAARNVVLLLKQVKPGVTLDDVADVLRDYAKLRWYVEKFKALRGQTALTQYFESEVLGEEKSKQFIMGLRLQLEDLTGNSMLHRVLCGKSDINLDRHLAEGGVLVIHTAMGPLAKLGDVFGQFCMLHFQQAVFRRGSGGAMATPHVLYVDEFPRYVNPDFERLLAIGRSFRCAVTLAVQTTVQAMLDEKPAFREVMVENTRNKIVLNPGTADEAKYLAGQMGEFETVERQPTYRRQGTLIFPWYHESYREEKKDKKRFPYTELMELPKFHAVVRIVRDGQPLEPVRVRLDLCEWDKKRRRAGSAKPSGSLRVTNLPERKPELRVRIRKGASDGFYKETARMPLISIRG